VETVATEIDGRVIRLGPLALKILAQRRRWVRWIAVSVLLIAIASAIGHVHRRVGARAAAVPILVARRLLRPGQVVGAGDLRLVARPSGPAGASVLRYVPEDVAGQVVVRAIAPGEAITRHDLVPVLQYYGVAARVPAGMRALDLVVPSPATFDGELVPGSRVDLLGAFEPERGQGFVTVLAPGTVLHVAASRDTVASGSGRVAVAGLSVAEGSSSAELEVAVPRDHERELVLAEAFGRVFVAVHPTARVASGEAPFGVLGLLPYLGATGRTGAAPVPSALVARLAPARPAAGRPRGSVAGPQAAGLHPPARPGSVWIVDVIEGGERTEEAVPRADSESGSSPGVSRHGEDVR